MCCTAGNYKISSTTIKNAAHLCAHLCKLLGISASQVDTYVLRHYDVTHKQCPAQMSNSANDPDWISFKK
jgi:N-acetylmuramoyl-L-alanine amidase CwlA